MKYSDKIPEFHFMWGSVNEKKIRLLELSVH
jgi:hypothetical protein